MHLHLKYKFYLKVNSCYSEKNMKMSIFSNCFNALCLELNRKIQFIKKKTYLYVYNSTQNQSLEVKLFLKFYKFKYSLF